MLTEDYTRYNSSCFCFFGQNDGSYTTEYISEGSFGQIREVYFADIKQESGDVCYIRFQFITTQTTSTDLW